MNSRVIWQQLKQVGKGSSIYGLGNVANGLLGFFLVPLYTHHLSTAEFGAYSLIITIFGVSALLVDAGLTSSVARYYFDFTPENSEEERQLHRKRLLSTALLLSTSIACVIAVFTFVGAEMGAKLLFPNDPGPSLSLHATHLRILAIALVFRGLTIVPMVYLRVQEQAVTYSLLTFGQLAVFLLLNVTLLTQTHLGVAALLYSLLFSTAFYAATLLWAVRADLLPVLDRAIGRELLRFGLPFLPVLLTMWVIDFSDRYLLGLYLSTSEVGIYSLGYKFGQAMQLLVTAFTMGWVPVRFKILSLGEPQAIYGRLATFYLCTAGLGWLALSAYAPEIVRLTSTASYQGAAVFVGPVGWAYLTNGLFVIAVTGLGVVKDISSMPVIALGGVVLNVGLNLLLIPYLGAIAAAYSTIIAYSFLAAGSLYYSQKVYPIAYEYRVCSVLAIGMLTLASAASLASGHNPWVDALLKLVVFPAYGGVVILSGMVRPREWGSLVSLFARFAPRFLRARLDHLSHSLATRGVGRPGHD